MKESRDRELYRGTLQQKREVWGFYVAGNTAKQIAAKFQPSLAENTIYKWFKEFKNLSAKRLFAIYGETNPPELIIEKWKDLNINYPEKLREMDELNKIRQSNEIELGNPNESIITPPNCFEKDNIGLCSNAGLRSDCGPCFYLRIGRTQSDIELLVKQSLSLPADVEKAKENFLSIQKNIKLT